MVELRLDHVTKSYGERCVLTNISTRLHQSPVALLGVNGAGKTTLLRILASLDSPDSGEVTLSGDAGSHSIGQTRGRARRAKVRHRQSVGFVPQEIGFPPRSTCSDVLHYVAWLRCLSPRDARERVPTVLERVGLADRANSLVARLSGGMRQRLNLAQALLDEPMLLLLDEPSAGLDLQQRAVLLDIVREVSKTSLVIYSTHLVDDVVAIASTIAVLHDGHFSFVGDLQEFAAVRGRGPVSAAEVEAAFLSTIRSTSIQDGSG